MDRKWLTLWQDSGFWSENFPDAHFDTPGSATAGLLARWLIRAAGEFRCATIMEIGHGNGWIQAELTRLTPCAQLIAADIRRNPEMESLQLAQQWDTRTESWGATAGGPHLAQVLAGCTQPILIFAVEWLDDLPTEIAHRHPDGRLVAIGPDGVAGPLGAADIDWAERWWPQPGALAVGRTRDVAWAWLARHAPPGSVLLTIDYGHLRNSRPLDAGFAAYRHRQRVPPDPTANLTASVAVDSLSTAVESRGCTRLHRSRLTDLPRDFWPTADPAPLTALALRSQEQLLRDPRRFGGFWLVMHRTPASRP